MFRRFRRHPQNCRIQSRGMGATQVTSASEYQWRSAAFRVGVGFTPTARGAGMSKRGKRNPTRLSGLVGEGTDAGATQA